MSWQTGRWAFCLSVWWPCSSDDSPATSTGWRSSSRSDSAGGSDRDALDGQRLDLFAAVLTDPRFGQDGLRAVRTFALGARRAWYPRRLHVPARHLLRRRDLLLHLFS